MIRLLSRFKLAQRLGLGFGALIAGLVVVGVGALVQIDSILESTGKLYRHPFTVSNTVRKIDSNIVRIHREMKDVALAQDISSIEASAKVVDRLEGEIFRDFMVIKDRFLGDESMYLEAEALFRDWRPIRQNVIRLMVEGKRAEAAEITKNEGAKHVDEIIAMMKALDAFAQKKAQEFFSSAEAGSNQAFVFTLTALVLTVGFGLAFTVGVARSIVVPANEVAEVSQAIAAGDLSRTITYSADDELGIMAGSLRTMLTGVIGEGQSIKHGIPILFWTTDSYGTLTFLNPIAEEIAAATTTFLSGDDVIEEGLPAGEVFKDAEEAVGRLIAASCASGEKYETEASFTAEGVSRFFLVTISPLKDLNGKISGTMGMGTETTQRKRAEKLLRDSEERYRNLFELESDALLVVDVETGRIMESNRAASEMYGYDTHEFKELRHTDLSAEPEAAQRSIDDHSSFVPLSYHRKKDGAAFPVEISIAHTTWQYQKIYIAAVRDIQWRISAERDLILAKEKAEEANLAKSRFLANMSHEIRTPMNGILGMLQLLKFTGLDKEQEDCLEKACISAQRLTRLLTDILDLSRVEADRMELRVEEFSLSECLVSTHILFEPVAEQSGLKLVLDAPHVERLHVKGDSLRLQQVLSNFVGNAIKFTQRGTVTLGCDETPAASEDEVRLLFTISDTGVGISDADIGVVFEPFAQAEGQRRHRYQGVGLGLAISRQLLELMGSDNLCIETDEGVGTTVYFSLSFPVCRQKTVVADEVPEAFCQNRCNILIAEDDDISAEVMTTSIGKLGHTPFLAKNGQEVLEVLEAHDCDLVLMDVQMPIMDGVEAARLIREGRAGSRNADVPIIAVTAYAMVGDRQRFIEAGMNEYLSKPFDIKELEKAINRFDPVTPA